MKKKIIFSLVLVFCLALAGSAFLYWKSQKVVVGLNADLPEGIRVVKSVFGEGWKVVNKIDGYEFTVPKAWDGVSEIEYIPSTEEEKYQVRSINIRGINAMSSLLSIDKFNISKDFKFNEEVRGILNEYGFSGDLIIDNSNGVEILKIREDIHLGGMYVYFLKKGLFIYGITKPASTPANAAIT